MRQPASDAVRQAQENAQKAMENADRAAANAQAAADRAVQEQALSREQSIENAVSQEIARQPNTIVFPGENGEPNITVRVDGSGIHVSQGDAQTLIPIHDVVPKGAVQISWAFAAAVGFLAIGLPISRAIARRIDRRGVSARNDSALAQQFAERFDTMERNLDTVAIEIERLSESQRFTSKLLTERERERDRVPVGTDAR